VIYTGRIELIRELSFTQAQQLRLFFKAKQTVRPYPRACLEITPDGKGIQWDKDPDTKNLEIAIADLVDLYLSKWKLNPMGVIMVSLPERMKYEIVILKYRVKLFQNNQLETIQPTNISA
jgi:hypothetical protein